MIVQILIIVQTDSSHIDEIWEDMGMVTVITDIRGLGVDI
jgi:hypothetical protein